MGVPSTFQSFPSVNLSENKTLLVWRAEIESITEIYWVYIWKPGPSSSRRNRVNVNQRLPWARQHQPVRARRELLLLPLHTVCKQRKQYVSSMQRRPWLVFCGHTCSLKVFVSKLCFPVHNHLYYFRMKRERRKTKKRVCRHQLEGEVTVLSFFE